MNGFDTAILVVLYGKKINDSVTLTTLSKCNLKGIVLTIVNNGPDLICDNSVIVKELEGNVKELIINEYLNNKPLSFLYNDFIRDNVNAERLIILDDDTVIEESFLSKLSDKKLNDYDVVLPIIHSEADGKIYYPVENDIVIEKEKDMDPKGTLSIGSGLMLNKKVINKLISRFNTVFDESYALYGVDMSIFRRIHKISKTYPSAIKIRCEGVLMHSLSRVGSKPGKFRTTERLIDAAITGRRYFCIRNEIFMLKVFAKSIPVIGVVNSVTLLCKYFALGCHDRSRLWKKSTYTK
ncbi:MULTISPECIES: glycosyl transferase [unclassified Tatumella]|uniref:glycosyl transferase n=1 Tax=unclassified Tatumella TaxID=2649542 RepID=UPI001BB03524|nr:MULTISPECIES: glycosyl transferase [unclassified Tatumella]MBS0857087.1 glycosyl transferase [Tatumella sp. JGM16]MBS0913802.1 glycosyl transferase [Tatumella sp. JGM91]